MSLQLWLPLKGGLTNYGCDDITVSNPGSFPFVDGKLGKAIRMNGTNRIVLSYSSASSFFANYIDSKSWSVSMWFKTSSLGSGQSSNGLWSFGYGPRASISGNGEIFFSLYNSSKSKYIYSGGNYMDGQWHHISCVADFNGTNTLMRMYVDGVLKASDTFSGAFTHTWENEFAIGNDPNNSIYHFNGDICDFRMYDHALSKTEAILLSEGLVLDYEFEDGEIENTVNLATKSWNGGWNNSGTATWNSNDTTINNLPFSGTNIYSVKKDTAGNSSLCLARTNGLAGKTVTVSTYIYLSGSMSANTVYLRSTTHNNTATDAICILKYNGNENPQNWPKNQWIRISGTGTVQSDETYAYICTYINNAGEYRALTAWQFEEKDHPTPYVDGTRSNEPVYDESGLSNNGSAQNISILEDSTSPCGIHVGKFNGSSSKIVTDQNASVFLPKEEITVTWWGSMDNWANYTRAISCTEGGGWNFEPYSSRLIFILYRAGTGYIRAYSDTTLASLSAGWHFFAATYDGYTIKLYIDGVFQTYSYDTSSTKAAISYAAVQLHIGEEAPNDGSWYNGKIAQVRVYATALSADRIKNLYETKQKITRNGSLIGKFDERYGTLMDGVWTKNDGYGSLSVGPNGELITTGFVWGRSDFIEVDPNIHTFAYDITYTSNGVATYYIGFELYDANFGTGVNASTQYLVSTNSADIKKHINGTVTWSAVGNGNPIKYIRLRVLNSWYNSSDNTSSTIHSISIRQVSNVKESKMHRNCVIDCDTFIEDGDKSRLASKGGIISSNFKED